MAQKTQKLQKWVRSILSFIMSLSISSTPAAAQSPLQKTYLSLTQDLEKGITAEELRQELSRVYTSSDDKLYLNQLLTQIPRGHVFKLRSAKMHTDTLKLVFPDNTHVTISNLLDQDPTINGLKTKLTQVSLRQALKNMQMSLGSTNKSAGRTASLSLTESLVNWILPQAQASGPLLAAGAIAAASVTAIYGSFKAGRMLKAYLYGRPGPSHYSSEEEIATLVNQCRTEKTSALPYQKSKTFGNLIKIEKADQRIFDSVKLQPVGKCNAETVARLARVAGLDIVPDGTEAFCEWAQKWMTCLAEYRGDGAPGSATEIAHEPSGATR